MFCLMQSMDVLQGNYYNKKQDKKSGKKLEQKKGSIKIM